MTFVKVDQIPKVMRRWHDLQQLIEEFENSDAKCAKMIFSEGEYKTTKTCYESLRRAIIRSNKPVKVSKRGNDIYLKKI